MTGFNRHRCCRFGALLLAACGLIALASSLATPAASAHQGDSKHVLILHSHLPDQPWAESITTEIEKVLSASTLNLAIHIEFLDVRHLGNPGYTELLEESLLSCSLKGEPFDIVLLSERKALDFALRNRATLLNNSPIVFSGMPGFDPAELARTRRITGILETPSFRETLTLALSFHPDASEVVVLGQTASETDLAYDQRLRKVAAEFADRARFAYWNDLPLPELTARLRLLTPNSLVFINGSIVDAAGQVLPFPEDIRQIRNACRGPLYAFRGSYLNYGIVGGKLTSTSHQGRLAAEMALQILQGKDPDEIPVVTGAANPYLFDQQQLGRFEVPAALLPEGSVIINEQPSFYTLSKKQLWIVLGIVAFFFADLLLVLYLRRKTEIELKASIAQTRLLLNSAAEGIYGLDLDGKCSFCNPAALRLLGYRDESELLGKDLHGMIHHTRTDGTPYAAEDCRICHAYQQSSRVHLEDEVFWRRDGSSFPVEYWSYPLIRGSRTVGAVISFLDISERKLAEEQLKEANRELDAFVYRASHDLRTPLSVISGYTDLLRQEYADRLDDDAREYLSAIEKNGEKMAGLIDDLLALAKAGSIEPPGEPVDTAAIVRGVLLGFDSQISRSRVRIKLQPLPAALVPETLLSQVFENLIGNALRYAAPAGDVIEVGGERLGDKVRFSVRDHGPGIPAKEANRVFEVFYRGSTGKLVPGSGIGLATVQKIARLYGGSAWVEKTPGGGATFYIEMQDRRESKDAPC